MIGPGRCWHSRPPIRSRSTTRCTRRWSASTLPTRREQTPSVRSHRSSPACRRGSARRSPTSGWRHVTERTRGGATVPAGAGLGARPNGREGIEGHESHEDHLAIYCYNGNEYLESMLGAFKARVGPINVNYRYVTEELQYLLDN